MSISTVLFDLGDTAYRFRPERRLAALAAASPLPPAEITARIWDSGFDAECDRGRYTSAEIVDQISTWLDLRLSAKELRAIWVLAWEPNEAVLAVAEALAPRVRVGMLSNNGPLLYDALPTHIPVILARFDPCFFSCDLGAAKPDPAIYATVQERLAAPPDRLLLIDDSAGAVAGARAAGWQAIHYTGQPDLHDEVCRLLADVLA
jgi:putative hydrolase of the HAD superfamily